MHFVKTMAPGWFASVMGTSVASLAAQLLFAGTAAVWIADALHYTAIAMLLVLGIAAVLRILIYPRAVFETISHPSREVSTRPSLSRYWLWQVNGACAALIPIGSLCCGGPAPSVPLPQAT